MVELKVQDLVHHGGKIKAMESPSIYSHCIRKEQRMQTPAHYPFYIYNGSKFQWEDLPASNHRRKVTSHRLIQLPIFFQVLIFHLFGSANCQFTKSGFLKHEDIATLKTALRINIEVLTCRYSFEPLPLEMRDEYWI